MESVDSCRVAVSCIAGLGDWRGKLPDVKKECTERSVKSQSGKQQEARIVSGLRWLRKMAYVNHV